MFLDSNHSGPDCSANLIFSNTEARNALILPKLFTGLANLCRTQGFNYILDTLPVLSYFHVFGSIRISAGVGQTVVLATMASRSKEEGQTDPLEDFVDFCRSMKTVGFHA